MMKVTVLYPNQPGNSFDAGYYFSKHTPMVQELLGPAMRGICAEQGIAGFGGAPAPFFALASLTFDSMETFNAAFAPHAERIMADIRVYFNAEPVIQFSEVKFGE